MHRFTIRAIAASVALGIGGSAWATDLSSVYQEARKYDATFAAAEATARAGHEKADQGRALWLPQVSASANYTHTDTTVDGVGVNPANGQTIQTGESTVSGHSYGYTVTANQPLYNVNSSVGNSQLQEQARLADVTFSAAKQSLILRVSQAYFDVLYAQDSLEYVRAQKQAVGQQLAQAKKSFEVGVATITDTHEAQASYDAIVATEIATENTLIVKQNAFLQLTGVPADDLAPLQAKALALPPDPDDMNVWLKRAEDKSLDIDAQRGSLAIAEAEIDKYRALRQPTLGAVAQYGETWTPGSSALLSSSDKTKTATIGVVLNIPLYTGGTTSSKLREALALRDSAQLQLEATRRAVAQNTKQAFLGVRAGAAQIRALEQARVSAQSSLDSTTLGREVGVRTTLDVLNSQQQLYSTKRDLAQARYNYLISKLTLAQAVGDLTEKDLDGVNNQLKH